MKKKNSSLKVCFLLTCLKLAQLFMLVAAVFYVHFLHDFVFTSQCLAIDLILLCPNSH